MMACLSVRAKSSLCIIGHKEKEREVKNVQECLFEYENHASVNGISKFSFSPQFVFPPFVIIGISQIVFNEDQSSLDAKLESNDKSALQKMKKIGWGGYLFLVLVLFVVLFLFSRKKEKKNKHT